MSTSLDPHDHQTSIAPFTTEPSPNGNGVLITEPSKSSPAAILLLLTIMVPCGAVFAGSAVLDLLQPPASRSRYFELWVAGLIVCVGFIFVALHAVWIRHGWVVSPGHVARRTALLRYSTLKPFDRPAKFELEHVRWSDGSGGLHLLSLHHASRWPTLIYLSGDGGPVQALGEYMASMIGIPLEHSEKVEPRPDWGE